MNSRWWGFKIDNCNQFDFRFDFLIEIKTWEAIIVQKVCAKAQQFRIRETKNRNRQDKEKNDSVVGDLCFGDFVW